MKFHLDDKRIIPPCAFRNSSFIRAKFDSLIAVKMALVQEIEGYVVAFKPAVRPKKKTGDTSFALDSR